MYPVQSSVVMLLNAIEIINLGEDVISYTTSFSLKKHFTFLHSGLSPGYMAVGT